MKTINTETESNLVDWGSQECTPGHEYGGIRDYYLLHVIIRGKGEYHCGGRHWELGKGDSFLIFPGQPHVYRADAEDPWSYFWIGFRGNYTGLFESIRLNKDNPVLRTSDEGELYTLYSGMTGNSLYSHPGDVLENRGRFNMILGRLCRERHSLKPDYRRAPPGKRHHVYSMETFIHEYFNTPVQVQDVVDFVQLERSYASRIFRQETGRSIGRVLMEYRISKACDYLKEGLTVKETAYSCGFRDYSSFLKAFKRETGRTPGSLRFDPEGSGKREGGLHETA